LTKLGSMMDLHERSLVNTEGESLRNSAGSRFGTYCPYRSVSYSSMFYDELPSLDDDTVVRDTDDMGDDAVSHGVRKMGACISRTLVLWLFSYTLMMIHGVMGYRSTSTIYRTIEFSFLWTGSVLGLVELALLLHSVCKQGGTLVSKERRIYMVAFDINPEEYIDTASLPLLRQLLWWATLLSILFVTAFATQLYSFCWLITGKIGMWRSLVPMIVMFGIALVYVAVMKNMSLALSACVAVILCDVLLFAGKFREDMMMTPPQGAGAGAGAGADVMTGLGFALSWMAVALPLSIVQIAALIHVGKIFIGKCVATRTHVELTARQLLCGAGFIVSIVMMLIAEILTIQLDFLSAPASEAPAEAAPQVKQPPFVYGTLPQILWMIALPLFVCAGLVIVHRELLLLVRTRGYSDPLPLARTAVLGGDGSSSGNGNGTFSVWSVQHAGVSPFLRSALFWRGSYLLRSPLLGTIVVRRNTLLQSNLNNYQSTLLTTNDTASKAPLEGAKVAVAEIEIGPLPDKL
jgi:hypothetical protein